MGNTISSVAAVFRSLVALVLLGIVGAGGWVAYEAFDSRARIDRELQLKTAENQRLTKENQRLDLAVRLLKVDHRVAEILVLDQQEGPDRPATKIRFTELAKDGAAIGEPREFTLDGDVVYLDAWVIKYNDDLIERGDPLRSTAVCLFRRIFGEHQKPNDGFALDAKGSRPAVYATADEMSPLERDIWANFWDYANDPAKAKSAGIRAVQGEAPSMRLVPGRRYKVELRSSGGLTIMPEGLQQPKRPET